jgi:hypothetical protein
VANGYNPDALKTMNDTEIEEIVAKIAILQGQCK